MKLNQVIAIEKGVKAKANSEKSELYKIAQKPALFHGFVKKYQPIKDDGERFPDEKHKVQFKSEVLLEDIGKCLVTLFNTEAAKDYSNQLATADVIVDGKVLFEKAPVSFLLYLEKELTDFYTFANSLPILSEDEDWLLDANAQLFKTESSKTVKTKKVQKPVVLYHATKEHPAQTVMITEDETVGYWEQVKMSGAITSDAKKGLLARVQALQGAVKSAREQANMVESVQVDVGTKMINWLMS